MNEAPPPSTPPVIRPPDLPQPPLPSAAPGVEPAPAVSQPPPWSDPPAVQVRIREAAASEEQAGSRAPFNTRVIAAVIDVLVAGGLQLAAMWVLPNFAASLAWLLAIAYLIGRDSLPLLGGQSIGKKAMKIKVVTLEGHALTGNWQAALIRNGVLVVVPFAVIEVIVLLTREDKPDHGRRLGDEWAKTQVIIAPPEIPNGGT